VEVERREALTLALKAILVTAILLWYLGTKEKTVYLMDFACFEPPADWKVTAEQILELLKRTGSFTEDSLKFQERMMQQSGVGPSTAWPPGITQVFKGLPHNESAEMSRKEAEVSAVGVVRVIKFAGFLYRSVFCMCACVFAKDPPQPLV
jgi:hypothetical protein